MSYRLRIGLFESVSTKFWVEFTVEEIPQKGLRWSVIIY